mmetsp:Transcript_41871/g.118385  ORF Transcript_41871/g.118385 Transcript_41871/m.118385 type:complete len:323 (+) Transcript_41871:127-1095(+)
MHPHAAAGARHARGGRSRLVPEEARGPAGALLVVAEEGLLDDGLLLHGVELPDPRGRRRGGPAADVAEDEVEVQGLARDADGAGADVGPGAHVLRLLLAPDDAARVHPVALVHVPVALHLVPHLVEGEGGYHLDGDDGDVGEAQPLALGEELVVDLPGAEHQPLHPAGVPGDRRVPLGDDALELGAGGHVLEGAHAGLVPEQRLRGGDDEGLPELPLELLAEAVEVVGGRREVHDLPVGALDLHAAAGGLVVGDVVLVVVAELQEALEAARGVLRALAVVAVREEQHEAALLQPLVLARADELVYNDLGCVREVTELRLPDR